MRLNLPICGLMMTAAMLSACIKETGISGPAASGEATVRLTLSAAGTKAAADKESWETAIRSADVYVYKDGVLENHSRAEDPDGNLRSVEVRCSYGTRDFKVIANCSPEKGREAARTGIHEGPAPVSLHDDNREGALIHWGTLEGVLIGNGTEEIAMDLRTNAARVSLGGVVNDLPEAMGDIVLRRVFLMRVHRGDGTYTDGYDPSAGLSDPALISREVGMSVPNGTAWTPGTPLRLYGFTNPASETGDVEETDDVTKLVVEAETGGTVSWYPVGLPGMQNNRSYDIGRLYITRAGSDDPNKYLSGSDVHFTLRVTDWEDGETQSAWVGGDNVLRTSAEDGVLSVWSYRQTLVSRKRIPWTASIETSRDGGTTWEAAEIADIPWLDAVGLSGEGTDDEPERAEFTWDTSSVTLPFRVTVTQDCTGGRTSAEILARDAYTFAGTASGEFGVSSIRRDGSGASTLGTVTPAGGVFHVELPVLPEGTGYMFRKAGEETNAMLGTVTRMPDADGAVTSCRNMFRGCSALTSVADFGTGSSTSFAGIFQGCSSLVRAPMMDLTGGADFSNFMFGCKAVREIPDYDFSSATTMTYAFRDCYSLTAVPELHTSRSVSFSGTFMECHSLVSVPLVETGNATNFYGMFMACKSLGEIPSLNTSRGTAFMGMFQSCEKITSIPPIDTSNGTLFKDMFLFCFKLKSIPALNTSKGEHFGDMFNFCLELEEVPDLDTSNGIRFENMFNSCTSLTKIPSLDVSKGTRFEGMFYNDWRLTDLGALRGLSAPLSLSMSGYLSTESLKGIIGGLAEVPDGAVLTLGAANLAKLDADDKADATRKGWTLE